jgi:hypothetical protein
VNACVQGNPAPYPSDGIPVVLFGAHMRGLPLNHQIGALGGRFVETVATAPRYRMHAVPGSIERPGISEAPDGVTGPRSMARSGCSRPLRSDRHRIWMLRSGRRRHHGVRQLA